jgi:hypothetical protein
LYKRYFLYLLVRRLPITLLHSVNFFTILKISKSCKSLFWDFSINFKLGWIFTFLPINSL